MNRLIGAHHTRRVLAGIGLAVVIGFSVVSGLALAGGETRHHDVVGLRTLSAAAFAASGLAEWNADFGLALAGAQTPVVNLSTVSAATLAASDTMLTSPSNTNPPVSAQQADAAAAGSMGGGNAVLETVLANLTDIGVPGMTNRPVWAVSVMPPGGIPPANGCPGCGPPLQGTYMLVFVDANTGALLYAASGGPVASSSSADGTSPAPPEQPAPPHRIARRQAPASRE